jgi:three-Cys-motif partner protein
MDMNRNVFWRDYSRVTEKNKLRMTRFWGDESWHEIVYSRVGNLFGEPEKVSSNDVIAEAFRDRLRRVAGFKSVPEPIPMRNRIGAVVYYLFFAAQKPVAAGIVRDIFNKYKMRGGTDG